MARGKVENPPPEVKGRGYQAQITYNGETRTLAEWAALCNVKTQTLYNRIFYFGYPVDRALTEKAKFEGHGKCRTVEWNLWMAMKQRCTDPNCKGYDRYGGRGIKVCKEWLESFQAFFDYMGPRPTKKHTLDRFPNNDGNYEPGNVRWATIEEQSRNTRRNVVLEYNGQRKVLKDWAREVGLSNTTLWNRLFTLGWKLERALTTPAGPNGRK